MNDTTEVLNVAVRNGKKKRGRKKKINLGIYKYFIAIGGVAIAAIIFLTMWFYNSHGGLVTLSVDDYLDTKNNFEARTVIYLGGNDDISKELTSVLQDIAKKQNKQYYYVDVSKVIKAKDVQELQNRYTATQSGYVVPMILVVENGKIVDTRTDKSNGNPSGLMLGYLDRDALIKFLKDNKVY